MSESKAQLTALVLETCISQRDWRAGGDKHTESPGAAV